MSFALPCAASVSSAASDARVVGAGQHRQQRLGGLQVELGKRTGLELARVQPVAEGLHVVAAHAERDDHAATALTVTASASAMASRRRTARRARGAAASACAPRCPTPSTIVLSRPRTPPATAGRAPRCWCDAASCASRVDALDEQAAPEPGDDRHAQRRRAERAAGARARIRLAPTRRSSIGAIDHLDDEGDRRSSPADSARRTTASSARRHRRDATALLKTKSPIVVAIVPSATIQKMRRAYAVRTMRPSGASLLVARLRGRTAPEQRAGARRGQRHAGAHEERERPVRRPRSRVATAAPAIAPSAPPAAMKPNERRASPMVNCAPMSVHVCTSITVEPTPTDA